MAAPTSATSEVFDIWWVIAVLRRRAKLLIAIVLLIPIITYAYVSSLKPIYSADTRLLIDGEQERVIDIQSVARGLNPDASTIQTEAQYIASRDIALKTVERMNLTEEPLFNPSLAWSQAAKEPEVGLIADTKTAIRGLMSDVKGFLQFAVRSVLGGVDDSLIEPGKAELASSVPPLDPSELAANILRGQLIVEASRVARVISIEFQSTDPAIAAAVSNGVAESYLADIRERRDASVKRASAWLTQRVNQMRQSVIEAEADLERFRRSNGLVEVGGASVLRQQISTLTERMIGAKAQLAELDARYSQVRGLLGAPGQLATLDSALSSNLINSLRTQESQLQRRVGELRTRFRDKHPEVIQATEELKQVRASIALQIDRIADSLGNEVQIAEVRAQSLQDAIDALQAELESKADAEARLRSLASEVEASRDLYELILNRLRETDVQDGNLRTPEARVITRAVVPKVPVAPRVNVAVLASLLGSIALAVVIAITLELAIRGFRNSRQLEVATGLPVLVQTPKLDEMLTGTSVLDLVNSRPGSMFTQSFRRLRTTLRLITGINHGGAYMVTSTIANEGKSSLLMGLAMVSARSGARVIVVDADAQNPAVHGQLNLPNEVGLSGYLKGEVDLQDIVEFHSDTGLYYITQGGPIHESDQAFASERMQKLFYDLRRNFDLVLVDAAPVSAVGDPLVLAPQVDGVVYVVQWEGPSRDTVIQNLRELFEIAENVLGVVLTKVDMRQQSLRGGVEYYYTDYGAENVP
jgi:capsular exopolysaccharide synthesis family protein